MSNAHGPDGTTNQPTIYQIRVQGHLGHQWSDRFEELSITLEDDAFVPTLRLCESPVLGQLWGLQIRSSHVKINTNICSIT